MIIKNQLLKALVLLIGMIGCMACSEQSEDNDNPPQAGSSNLTVTPGKLNFKAEGGTQELRVKTTYEYFGYDFTADWISADFKDDATYNIITVTAKPNTTSSVRKATFKIIGSNKNFDRDKLAGTDILVINTNAVSHACTQKAKSEVSKGAEILIVSSNNLEILDRKINALLA